MEGQAVISALAGLLGAAISAALVYIATRKRDAPTLAIAREQAQASLQEAVAAANAELSESMMKRLEMMNTRVTLLEAQVDSERTKRFELENRLDECLRQMRGEQSGRRSARH